MRPQKNCLKVIFSLPYKKGREKEKNAFFFTLNEMKSRIGCSGICSSRGGVMLRAWWSLNTLVCFYKNKTQRPVASDLMVDKKRI